MEAQMSFEKRQGATTKEDILAVMKHSKEVGILMLSRREIAQLVARKVTPRLISLIEELHTDGVIMRGLYVLPNGAQAYTYVLKD